MKIEIFKNKKKFRKGGFHTNPNIGWEIILGIALALIAASLTFGIYFFMRTNEDPVPASIENNSQINIVKKDRIQKVLQRFSEREQKSSEILNSPSPLIDPSL